jgi:hypothetical protein
MKELTAGYGGVLPILKSATSITEASNKFLYDFETPSSPESKEQQRSEQGLEYYTKYKHITADSLGKITEEKKEVTEKTEKKKVKLIFDMVLVGKIED